MVDAAEKQSLEVDSRKLSKLLKIPVIPVIATQRKGIGELSEAVLRVAAENKVPRLPWLADGDFSEDDKDIHLSLSDDAAANNKIFARYNYISDIYQE